MNITVVAVAAESYGALSVLKELYREAVEKKEHKWSFILSAPYVDPADNVEIILQPQAKKNWIARLMWELFCAKGVALSSSPDVILSLQNLVVFGCKKPQMLYLHNVIPFQSVKKFSFLKGSERFYAVYQYLIGALIKHSAKKADMVVVQSCWLKDALLNKLRKGRGETIIVAPTEVNPEGIEKSEIGDGTRITMNKFMYPAAPTLFKNHKCIVDAVSILKSRSDSAEFSVDLTLNNGELGICDERINMIGALPRNELLARYKDYVLVFPSYIESYGMPLVEARLAGAMILAADLPYAHEVLSGYLNVMYFDPFNPKELADCMEKLMGGTVTYKVSDSPVTSADTWTKIMDAIALMKKKG